MKGIHHYLLVFLAIVLLIACKKSDLDNNGFLKPGRTYDLAVEGGFNTFTVSQYIRLTKPALYPDSAPTPISKASVVVNNGRVDMVYRETKTLGVYMATSNDDPNYNKAYTLTIKYNGKTYTAVDTLRQVVNIVDDFLPLSTRTVDSKTVEVNVPKHTFGYLNSNKWYISYKDIPTWHPSRFDQTKYYSYTHLLGSPNSLYPLNNLKRKFSLAKDDGVLIYKISLSENYAKYLYAVFMETDWSGIFSSVPVNVQGNVSGNAQGYFSANDIDFKRYPAKDL